MIRRAAFQLAPLSYLADIRPSGVDKHTHPDEVPVRLCNYTDIYYREHITSDIAFMEASATREEVERFALAPGDVVMTKDSETADDIGIPALVVDRLGDVLLGYHNALIRPSVKLEPRFLFWFLSSRVAAAYWETRARGVTRVGLRAEDVAALPVPLPPLAMQRRIADMLDAETARIDTLIAKNERVLALLQIREGRILEDAIYGAESRPVGIHYLATYVNGYPFKPDDRSDEGTPIVRIAQLLGDTRQQDYYAGEPDPYCHIDSGDLIFSWSATLAARIWDGGPAFLNQHLFKVEPHDGVDRDWLLHALNAAVPRLKSMTHGSTMTHITRPMMTRVRVPMPSRGEQRRIARSIRIQFDRLAALRTKVDRQQELLRLRRQALITAAVTGQIEV